MSLSLTPQGQAPRHEGIYGSGGIAPRILNFGPRWWWVVRFTILSLHSRAKRPRLSTK